jgi:hypothetical protein
MKAPFKLAPEANFKAASILTPDSWLLTPDLYV